MTWVILFPVLFSVSTHADESRTHEENIAGIGELIGVIAPSYDCTVSNFSVSPLRVSGETFYRVEGKSSGERCDEALHMLNYRGKARRWTFRFVNDDPRPEQPETRQDSNRNYDLIHEINPKGDT